MRRRVGRRGPAVVAIAVLGLAQFVGLQLASATVVPPAVVGAATTFGANNGPNSTAVPAGTVPGDVLVSTVESYPFTTITCPTGWTMAWDGTNGSNVRVAMCVGTVGSTVPSTVHIGVNPPTEVSIVTQAFSGVNTSDPIDASGEAASLTLPSVKASAGDLLVFGEGSALWDGIAAAPSGAKLGANVYAGTSQAAQATEIFSGGGSTPTSSWILSSSSPAVSGVVALLGSSSGAVQPVQPVQPSRTVQKVTPSSPQAITFTSSPPADPTVGGTYTVTARGGRSGQPVVFSIDGTSTFWACSVTGATVSLVEAGTCVIDANQAGTSSYQAAPQVQQSFTIQAAASDPPPATSPPPTSPPPTATGGNCTNPTFSTSDTEGTINTDPSATAPELWWVDNDAWSGSAGPQTLYVCSASSWYATSDQTNNGGAVETYPNTEYDVGGRGNNATDPPISSYSSITSTFSEAYPTTGDSFDAAYDLWTDNWTHETMIWNQWGGTQDYWGNCALSPSTSMATCGYQSYATTLSGVAYDALDLGGEVIFFRDTQVASGSVDILAAYDFEVSMGWASASDVPTQLEYGVEICSTTGTQTFPMTGVTFSLS